MARGLVEPSKLWELYSLIRESLASETRYISIDPDAFEEKLPDFLESVEPPRNA